MPRKRIREKKKQNRNKIKFFHDITRSTSQVRDDYSSAEYRVPSIPVVSNSTDHQLRQTPQPTQRTTQNNAKDSPIPYRRSGIIPLIRRARLSSPIPAESSLDRSDSSNKRSDSSSSVGSLDINLSNIRNENKRITIRIRAEDIIAQPPHPPSAAKKSADMSASEARFFIFSGTAVGYDRSTNILDISVHPERDVCCTVLKGEPIFTFMPDCSATKPAAPKMDDAGKSERGAGDEKNIVTFQDVASTSRKVMTAEQAQSVVSEEPPSKGDSNVEGVGGGESDKTSAESGNEISDGTSGYVTATIASVVNSDTNSEVNLASPGVENDADQVSTAAFLAGDMESADNASVPRDVVSLDNAITRTSGEDAEGRYGGDALVRPICEGPVIPFSSDASDVSCECNGENNQIDWKIQSDVKRDTLKLQADKKEDDEGDIDCDEHHDSGVTDSIAGVDSMAVVTSPVLRQAIGLMRSSSNETVIALILDVVPDEHQETIKSEEVENSSNQPDQFGIKFCEKPDGKISVNDADMKIHSPAHCPARPYCMEVRKLRAHLAACSKSVCTEQVHCWKMTQVISHFVHCIKKNCQVCPQSKDEDCEEAKFNWLNDTSNKEEVPHMIVEEVQPPAFNMSSYVNKEGEHILLEYFTQFFYETFAAFCSLVPVKETVVLPSKPLVTFYTAVVHTTNCKTLQNCRLSNCHRLRVVISHWCKWFGLCSSKRCLLCIRIRKICQGEKREVDDILKIMEGNDPNQEKILRKRLMKIITPNPYLFEREAEQEWHSSIYAKCRIMLRNSCINTCLFYIEEFGEMNGLVESCTDMKSANIFNACILVKLLFLSRYILYRAASSKELFFYLGCEDLVSYNEKVLKCYVNLVETVTDLLNGELGIFDEIMDIKIWNPKNICAKYSEMEDSNAGDSQGIDPKDKPSTSKKADTKDRFKPLLPTKKKGRGNSKKR